WKPLAGLPHIKTVMGIVALHHVGPNASLVALPTSRDLFICAKDLFVEAMDRKGPSHTGIRARPGQVKQSGTTSKFGPIRSAASCRAERFLSGGRRRPGTCQIVPKSCSSLPSVITNW